MGDVDDYIADLPETVGSFVEAEEFRDCGGGVDEEFAGRYVGW